MNAAASTNIKLGHSSCWTISAVWRPYLPESVVAWPPDHGCAFSSLFLSHAPTSISWKVHWIGSETWSSKLGCALVDALICFWPAQGRDLCHSVSYPCPAIWYFPLLMQYLWIDNDVRVVYTGDIRLQLLCHISCCPRWRLSPERSQLLDVRARFVCLLWLCRSSVVKGFTHDKHLRM